MKLYHYFEKEIGPFKSISELPDEEAENILQSIRINKPDIFLSKRPDDYLLKRRRFEEILRNEFIKSGGTPEKTTPHYMVVLSLFCPDFLFANRCGANGNRKSIY